MSALDYGGSISSPALAGMVNWLAQGTLPIRYRSDIVWWRCSLAADGAFVPQLWARAPLGAQLGASSSLRGDMSLYNKNTHSDYLAYMMKYDTSLGRLFWVAAAVVVSDRKDHES